MLDACDAMLASLCPGRQEMAGMYRVLARNAGRTLSLSDWQALLVAEGNSADHAEAAVAAFAELELLLPRASGVYALNHAPARRDLSQSPSYRALSERQAAGMAWLERLRHMTTDELIDLLACPQ
ncbi:hypothetical protein HS125_09270 [bacterium]|nr:hypothetical protein [bacterium]